MAPLLRTIAGLSIASVALCSASTPCSKVGIYLQNANQTDANENPRVPAQLAYDCITSVPFNQSAAIKLIDGMKLYFKWHSTTSWLADPPREYAEKVQPATDIWAQLENILDKAIAGSYKNEFEAIINILSWLNWPIEVLTLFSLATNFVTFRDRHMMPTFITSRML